MAVSPPVLGSYAHYIRERITEGRPCLSVFSVRYVSIFKGPFLFPQWLEQWLIIEETVNGWFFNKSLFLWSQCPSQQSSNVYYFLFYKYVYTHIYICYLYINVLMCTRKTHKAIISFSTKYLLPFPFTTLFCCCC